MYFNKIKADKRLLTFLIIVIFLFIIIIFRVIQLSNIFEKNNIRHGNKKIIRGMIFDRRGVSLAITEEASTIGIAPKEIIDPYLTSQYLAGYLNIDYNEILQKLYLNQNKSYILLKRKIDNYTAELILDLNLPGVYRDFEYKRIYPANKLASNLLGFVRKDTLEGMSGLELIWEDLLSNSNNLYSGYNIHLTIDSLIQYELEKALLKGLEKSNAKKAIGIMMDIETGEILAMANLPNFDPNNYFLENVKDKNNWAISYPIEPGSIMKPIFAAMLMNENPDIIHEHVYCNGEFNFKTGSVRCLRQGKIVSHGEVDLEEIIQESCNVGIIQLTKQLQPSIIYKYLLELGFNQNTGIVPSKWEHTGFIPKLDNWVESTTYYLPIGQGMLATPIQLITAFSALLNNGVLIKPILLKKIESEDKKLKEITKIEAKHTSFQSKTLEILKKYLWNVTHKGTAKLAQVEFVDVIGKTGTGQKSGPFGYSGNFTASFIGAFPYPKPKYSVLIIYDDVSGEFGGGNLAAPVFSDFLKQIKNILITQPYIEKINIKEDITLSPKKALIKDKKSLPDFSNYTLKDFFYWKTKVLDEYTKKENISIEIEIFGNGYIIKQYPKAGTPIETLSKIHLYLSKDNF